MHEEKELRRRRSRRNCCSSKCAHAHLRIRWQLSRANRDADHQPGCFIYRREKVNLNAGWSEATHSLARTEPRERRSTRLIIRERPVHFARRGSFEQLTRRTRTRAARCVKIIRPRSIITRRSESQFSTDCRPRMQNPRHSRRASIRLAKGYGRYLVSFFFALAGSEYAEAADGRWWVVVGCRMQNARIFRGRNSAGLFREPSLLQRARASERGSSSRAHTPRSY